MTIPRITPVDFGGPDRGDLLVLGPSLGTSARTLWSAAAPHLTERVRVIGWDLPGHGYSAPAAEFSVPDLAAAVLAAADRIAAGRTFHYAGDSLGGAVGLQLLLDAPQRMASATLICTGAVIGTPADWQSRAATVRAGGTDAIVDSAPARWFAPGFVDRRPDLAAALVDALRGTDAPSYAAACAALARFDVTERLGEVTTPVLAIAGALDVATPPELLQDLASGVTDGQMVVLDGVGHLAPAEAPARVGDLILSHLGTAAPSAYDTGMSIRRQVLGDDHVDRALASTTGFTADFQELITRYAWGTIWRRPGLDRRSRSLITLTALIARGHHEELAMHLRAARRNGLSIDEIKELLLQTAIYCGVPDANTAFRIAGAVFEEDTR